MDYSARNNPDNYHLSNNSRESLKTCITILGLVLSISDRKLTGAFGIIGPIAI
jgi:hypothetical protein